MYKPQTKNLRRLHAIHRITYVVLTLIGFVVMGLSMLKKH
jgi:hypothetical protein